MGAALTKELCAAGVGLALALCSLHGLITTCAAARSLGRWEHAAGQLQLVGLLSAESPSQDPLLPLSAGPMPTSAAASSSLLLWAAVVGVALGALVVGGVFGTFLCLPFWRRRDPESQQQTRALPAAGMAPHMQQPHMQVVPHHQPRSGPMPMGGQRMGLQYPPNTANPGHNGHIAPAQYHHHYPHHPPNSGQSLANYSGSAASEPHLHATSQGLTSQPRGYTYSAPPVVRKDGGYGSTDLGQHSVDERLSNAASGPPSTQNTATNTSSHNTNTNGSNAAPPPPTPASQQSAAPAERPSKGPGGSLIVSQRELQRITGLQSGDPFLRHVAPAYKWCMQPIEKMIPVEEGVNAATAAAHVILKQWRVPGSAPGPAPVQLSAQDVQEQIELLASGLIDRGGTAVVFRCRWPRRFGNNHMLAAKVMMSCGAGYDMSKELSSFRHEADVLTRCSHRNIVRLYGYCLEAPNVCLIMELLPSSLKARLYGTGWQKAPTFARNEQRTLAAPSGMMLGGMRQQDTLPAHKGAPMKMREVLLLSRDIAEGLAHLHAKVKTPTDPQPPPDEDEEEEEEAEALKRVIHRDLKPANVLINSRGVAKISDFGLAREHRNSTGLETNNPHMGTLRYMAPELISSVASAKLTSKVDIYSLAILMWEMVARKVPWHEINDLQVPLQVYSGKRPGTPGFTPPEPGSNNLDLTNFGPHTVAEMEVSISAPLNNLPPADSEPSFNTFPAFTTIIHACWQPNPRSRPSAATVFKQLQLLVEAAGISKPAK